MYERYFVFTNNSEKVYYFLKYNNSEICPQESSFNTKLSLPIIFNLQNEKQFSFQIALFFCPYIYIYLPTRAFIKFNVDIKTKNCLIPDRSDKTYLILSLL